MARRRSCLRLFALGIPAFVFEDGAAVELVAFFFEGGHRVVMALFGAGQGGFGFLRVALALGAFAFLFRLFPRLLLLPLAVAAGLCLLEGEDGGAVGLLVFFRLGLFRLGRFWRFGLGFALAFAGSGFAAAQSCLGSAAFSAKAPLVPTGRRRTTPGLAIAAATILGSCVSLAKPWWKALCPKPQASSAAFIDGAASASSKKPRLVM